MSQTDAFTQDKMEDIKAVINGQKITAALDETLHIFCLKAFSLLPLFNRMFTNV